LGTLVAFTARQEKAQGITQPIGFDMDFAAEASATPP
jgi:hypothetical protein